jgi:putative aldouronate transport system permease protein
MKLQGPGKPMASFGRELWRNRALYLLAVPGIICFLLFNYLPMFGIIVAFKNFNYRDGFFRSPWTGFKNFEFFFTSSDAYTVTRNTIVLNVLFIMTSLVLQIGFAVLLNEVRAKAFKKLTQSFMFFPYFISWIVVSVFIYNFFHSEYGSLNRMLKSVGMHPVSWLVLPQYWTWILTVIYDWKWTGFGVIIYLAAIVGINEELFEAAEIDGARRGTQISRITLPLIMPTAVVLTLLAIGRIMLSDFGMIYGIVADNSALYPTTNVIDTYVYRALRHMGDIGMSSAVGLYQSVVGFILVLGSNLVARRFSEDGALF